MKLFNKSVALLIVLLGLASLTNAQGLKIPQPSSGQTITQDFGLGKITLTYSRPNVKGRKIFGGMEPLGVVWRTGANAATRIKFTEDVKIEGKDLPANMACSVSRAKKNGPLFSTKQVTNGELTNIKKVTMCCVLPYQPKL